MAPKFDSKPGIQSAQKKGVVEVKGDKKINENSSVFSMPLPEYL